MRRLPLTELLLAAAGLSALALLPACGEEPPPGPGFNRLPGVRVWAIYDRTTTPTRVDIGWQGIDLDGTVVGFLYGFVPVSGVGGCGEHWNPVRPGDRRFARFTTRTDTTIWLGGRGGLPAADEGFAHFLFVITAVDNDGGIGPTPRCVDLSPAPAFAKPFTRFTLHLGDETRPVDPASPPDTVGMFRPFSLSYDMRTPNGGIARHRWRVVPQPSRLPGEGEWSDDIGDTLRAFPNGPSGYFAGPGAFRLVVEAMDEIGMHQRDQGGEAVISSDTCTLVVNFPPRTRMLGVENRYRTGVNRWDFRMVDFGDATPDTVPMGSWVRLSYRGSDDARDMAWTERDRDGISYFQVRYRRFSGRIPGGDGGSPWLDNHNGAFRHLGVPVDTNSFNLGSFEYELSARALDEWGTPDIDGVSVALVGNFNPSLTAFHVEDDAGSVYSGAAVDTLTWNWWAPSNRDTIDLSFDPPLRKKTFRFRLRAAGHDDPRDPPGSAVKAWRYFVLSDAGTGGERSWLLGKAGDFWFDAATPDVLDESVEVTFYTDIDDIRGDAVFDRLPGYVGRDLTVHLRGRDTHTNWREPEFAQWVILGGHWELHNSILAGAYGRWTNPREVRFRLRMVR